MSHTLLEVVQSVASSLNSDAVNSIGDTPESLQIAECVKTSYLNMLGRYDLPEHNQVINLNSPVNPESTPTLLIKPNGVNRIEWLQYFDSNVMDSNSTQQSQFGAFSHDLNLDIVTTSTSGTSLVPPGYLDVEIADPHWFLNYISSYSLGDNNVGNYNLTFTQNTTGLPQQLNIKYKNDHQPRCCAIIANQFVIFDSFDFTQESSLTSAKSIAYAWVMPPFELTDGFVIPLDDQQYPMLLSEAKSLAWFELKQMPHQKAELEVNRQLASLQKFKALANKPSPFDYLPNFGRSPGTGGFAIFKPR